MGTRVTQQGKYSPSDAIRGFEALLSMYVNFKMEWAEKVTSRTPNGEEAQTERFFLLDAVWRLIPDLPTTNVYPLRAHVSFPLLECLFLGCSCTGCSHWPWS